MKKLIQCGFIRAAFLGLTVLSISAPALLAATSAGDRIAPIPMAQLAQVAGKQYQGDGLSVATTPAGTRLRCTFQRLEGLVTREGLWLTSTADHASGERFRVMASEIGRGDSIAPFQDGLSPADPEATPLAILLPGLPATGRVNGADNLAQFIRPGLTEEYSVSMDGVRQDFIVAARPDGAGELRVTLAVTGAKAESFANGVRLVLHDSGRKLVYHRLRVTDAGGQELAARLEVTATTRLAVVVDDTNAVYPIRIDPTFSDADWISLSALPGTDNTVTALALDGSGNLYIGGTFTAAGDVLASRVAKWNGNTWAALGGGLNNSVNALAVSGSTVYVGGDFTQATNSGSVAVAVNYIAAWNGSAWAALGSGVAAASSPRVRALAISGSDLYAGGTFESAGGNAASCIARWNGSAWSAVGLGVDDTVNALAVSGSDVYVAGRFLTATNTGGATVTVNRIAKWNGTIWAPLGEGVNNAVNALAVSGGSVYLGGNFLLATNTGGASVFTGYIAQWDGAAWQPLGSGTQNTVAALAVSGSDLFVGGSFSSAGGNILLKYLARWNGSTWLPATAGINNNVSALVASGSEVYAGGAFNPINGSGAGDVAKFVAKWNASATNWISVNAGLNNSVGAVAVWNGELYAGGSFTFSGNPATNFIAKWNGDTWSALGSGVNNYVSALLPVGSVLYVGGSFTSAGGTNATRIARWDGNTWSKLGSGMNGSVYALAMLGSDLYAGGAFLSADGNTVNRIARWDGSSWVALGTGLNNDARALAVMNNNLYVGGTFTTANGNSANRIAQWDGSNWSALGAGLNNTVLALAAADTNLYVGGNFTTAGPGAANRIAKWNGSAWAALGAGVSGNVSALAASGSNVYAGGSFTLAGTTATSRIALWNGSSWSALGSGVNNTVNALTLAGGNLYAGGDFTLAGGKVSAYVAKASVGLTPLPGRFTNTVYSPGTGFSCTFVDATVGQPYRVQASPSLSPASWTDYTNFNYTGPTGITDASAGSATNRFFRAVTP